MPLTDTIYIGGIPTISSGTSKTYSFGNFVTGAATDCDINFSFIVKNNANTDVTTSLVSFISMTPSGDSALRTF
jgi:hypothetical protein